MNQDRLNKLLQFLEKDPDDSFTRYAIALEYQKSGQTEEAIRYYTRLAEINPAYLGTWYQLGWCYEKTGNEEKARETYRLGIQQARLQGNQHTLAELQNALMKLELGEDI
ncbi:MAG: tetratricopeptide repeat protein [Bacteroidetes bacterium]|nr:tetratricopeptide repeat protein [Bacteroidota bacterium]